jgi:anti-sigma factor RsiW
VDIREQLVAYLDGTLTLEQRWQIARHLATSRHWRDELEKLERTASQLRRDMPGFGQPHPAQLQALLPYILARTSPESRRWDPWKKAIQTSFLVCGALVMLVLVPLLLHSASVDAGAWSPNVPRSTATQIMHSKDSTAETSAHLVFEDISVKRDLVVSPVARLWSASPVPVPAATFEPSREAPSKHR